MPKFTYPAIRCKQSDSEKRVVLFCAKCNEIGKWSGVPQKKRFEEGAETTGFQREQNIKRIESIKQFFGNAENIVQNPLLCASRAINGSTVRFVPAEGQTDSVVETGTLEIELQELDDLSLLECLEQVQSSIESRLSELPDSNSRLDQLRRLAQERGHIEIDEEPEEEEEHSSQEDEQPNFESAIFEESHLLDFWEEVAGRAHLLKELREDFEGTEFLGFTKDAMCAFLKPVVLVDGQHRHRGALLDAEEKLQSEPLIQEIADRIERGESTKSVESDMLSKVARLLPISLLQSDDPAEQVFQFVVVNQKATPIGKALLGTIVSTTLSTEEMASVQDRLSSAGIDVEESRAITFLSRSAESPFVGLVERGLAGDKKDLLQWNVLGSLVSMFRSLKGGVLYGKRNDYADKWRRKHLDASQLVSDFTSQGFDSPFAYWSSLNGPWRDVFIAFFACIRTKFGNDSDPDKPNFWGKPRTSNLFNKISLTILAADFFQYLSDTKKQIDSVADVSDLVDDWLEDVNLGYFDKDWELSGTKKDSVGIRKRWAELWSEYRRNPTSLPDKRLYRAAL